MFRKTLTMLTLALAVGLAGAVASGTAEAAPKVKKKHYDPIFQVHRVHAEGRAFGFIPHFVKVRIAKRNAIENWRTKVAHRFGPEFARWQLAQGKSVDCFRNFAMVVCEVSARPRPEVYIFGSTDFDSYDDAPEVATTVGDNSSVEVTIFGD